LFDQYFEKFFGIDTRVVEQIFFAYVGESVESRKNERPAERYEFLQLFFGGKYFSSASLVMQLFERKKIG